MSNESDRFLNVGEVAALLAIPVSWVYNAVESGKLPSYKFGKYRRVKKAELQSWLEAQREA